MAIDKMFAANERALDRLQKVTERDIKKYYAKALVDIRAEIAQYEAKGQLTKAAMMQYGRLESLEKQVSKKIGVVSTSTTNTMRAGFTRLYEDSYYRTAYSFEKTVNAKLAYAQLNPRLVKEIILNPFDRIGWLRRNSDNNARLTRQLREEIFSGLTRGLSYKDIAKQVKNRMDIGATNAVRIVQTESHRIRESAKLDSMVHAQEIGVEQKKRWLSTLDGSTRDSHQELDGETIELMQEFDGESGSGLAPGQMGSASEDINCRCTLITVIEGFEPRVRRAREVEGKRGEIIGYKNYKEWKKGRLDK